jgi:hypothetical protein
VVTPLMLVLPQKFAEVWYLARARIGRDKKVTAQLG